MLNVHRITAIMNEVTDHYFTFEIVCGAFIDRLDFLIILKGIKGIRNSHAGILGGRIHAESI